jgi:hypothetical protein
MERKTKRIELNVKINAETAGDSSICLPGARFAGHPMWARSLSLHNRPVSVPFFSKLSCTGFRFQYPRLFRKEGLPLAYP